MKNSAIDSKTAGQRNEMLVLQMLLKSGRISQAQICKNTGLNSSTISYIVKRLRDKNLITETAGKSTKRGAKPVSIEINPTGLYTVGIEINPSYIIAALFNFTSQMVDSIKVPLGNDHSPENVIELVEVNVCGLLGKNEINSDKLTGIGITLSGSISSGVVKLSSPLGWKNVPLVEMLVSKFSCPIELYTTKVRLLAELAENSDLASKNIIYINVANGVGCTVLLDGKLLQGATNRCGELGHIVMDPNGPKCGCGQNGCLEAIISGPAIVEKYKNLSGKPIPQEFSTPEKVLGHIADLIQKDDEAALKIRDYISEKLSSSVAMTLNLYDPDTIILAGYVLNIDIEFFKNSIQNKFATDLYDHTSRNINIIPAQATEHALATGVAAAVLQKKFNLY